jgi:hypothetical protein
MTGNKPTSSAKQFAKGDALTIGYGPVSTDDLVNRAVQGRRVHCGPDWAHAERRMTSDSATRVTVSLLQSLGTHLPSYQTYIVMESTRFADHNARRQL